MIRRKYEPDLSGESLQYFKGKRIQASKPCHDRLRSGSPETVDSTVNHPMCEKMGMLMNHLMSIWQYLSARLDFHQGSFWSSVLWTSPFNNSIKTNDVWAFTRQSEKNSDKRCRYFHIALIEAISNDLIFHNLHCALVLVKFYSLTSSGYQNTRNHYP